ncbi:hypothetical protein BIV57_01320 [Mangrovactinospora gilvigrisea]|uniref:Solute-binding protein family 5 domain-containing protein n=1 Tax=Mangrovactinospora gilvigrisea TaxID=1428644 RepID=A0A1J7C187_9ACTN|nr:ABC transporter substrate-binding protein [Mangrovactinospora gilvigrisea]OIV39497.1 hypothetical protein BIV57_01320 [Mangrovactinospora gilvigrisea]
MRRSPLPAALTALALAATLAACSTSRGSSGSDASNIDTLNMTASSATSTFVRNWNGFSPATDKAPGTSFFYEPLIRIDTMHAKTPEGWLAKSFAWSNAGKTLTFHLRPGVTWSDGKPFTSADVRYTFELPTKTPGLAVVPIGYRSLATPDAHTVVIDFAKPAYQKLATFSTLNIYPQHIWAHHNPKSWTNPDPVGTGPATVSGFSPQQIALTMRKNYWGGPGKGVKKVDIKAFATPETAKAMVLNNQLDWTSINWQSAKKYFTSKDPAHNHYWVYPTGGDSGLDYNTGKAPLDDVHVRRALSYAADPQKLLPLAPTGQGVANVTGYSAAVYGSLIAPAYRNQKVTADLSKAKAELAKASYKLNSSGVFTKGGKAYPLTIKSVAEYTNWPVWADGLAEQWKEDLGLKVSAVRVPLAQMTPQLSKGDYDIAWDWQVNGSSAWASAFGVLHSANTAPEGKPALTDYTRWNNPTTDRLLNAWQNTNPADLAAQQKYAYQLQKITVDNMPFRPLVDNGSFVVASSKNWTGWPSPANTNYVPGPTSGPDTTMTVLNLKPTR